jgi:hypothetical protein
MLTRNGLNEITASVSRMAQEMEYMSLVKRRRLIKHLYPQSMPMALHIKKGAHVMHVSRLTTF